MKLFCRHCRDYRWRLCLRGATRYLSGCEAIELGLCAAGIVVGSILFHIIHGMLP